MADKVTAQEKQANNRIGIRDIALIGMMTAVIEVCKLALAALPNIELVTFWIILFTLYFGRKTVYAVLVFILLEISIYGLSLWTVQYLYVWPLLALITFLFRKKENRMFCSLLSGFFGLFFGAACALPYLAIGGVTMAFNWWVAGIPYDLIHGVANFALMLVLYEPVKKVLERQKP